MKRVFSAIISLLILFSFVVSAFSVDIDGFDKGTEWDGATTYKLVDGESNCNVKFAAVKVKFDVETNAVFLCFMFVDPSMEQDNTFAGVSLTVENSSPFEITMSSSPAGYDISRYSFDGAVSIDKNNGATCEIRIGIKDGLPQALNCTVRFIDAFGEPSNYYDFELFNEFFVETTALVIAPTRDNSDPAYNSDLITSKTTRVKTTKEKTTKERTTKERTTKERTTKERTTKKATTKKATTKKATTKKATTRKLTTTKKAAVKTSAQNSYTSKTKKQTTKAATIKNVQSAAVKTTKHTTAYSVKNETASRTVSETKYAAAQPSSEYMPTTFEYTQALQTRKTVSLSQGQKYKKVITAVGGVLFLLIACFGVFSAKRKNNVSEKSE